MAQTDNKNLNKNTSTEEEKNPKEKTVLEETPILVSNQECYLTPKETFHSSIGGIVYWFKKGERIKVPINVRDILQNANKIAKLG